MLLGVLVAGMFSVRTIDAAPAKKAIFVVSQPDGTEFKARIYGDEFSHRTTTLEGKEITQDSEGYWCLAQRQADGSKIASRKRIGCPDRTYDEPTVKSASAVFPRKNRRAIAAEMIEKRLKFTKENIVNNVATKAIATPINVLVLLVEFKDVKFEYTKSNFENLLNKRGYNDLGATGCVAEYFEAQIGDFAKFNFIVSPVATLDGYMKDYGGNDGDGYDQNPEGMVLEACEKLDAQLDFKQFDNFGYNQVDYLFVFFAGGDEAEYAGEDAIWSHASSFPENMATTFDGVKLSTYACTSEKKATNWKQNSSGEYYATKFTFTAIGTFCHEFSHMIGLMDMYDTDYEDSGGKSDALWGVTSIMDSGNSNNDGNTPPNYNAIDRHFLGLSSPKRIDHKGSYTLNPVNLNGEYYRIDTKNENEYFLIECRNKTGWDSYIKGSGMLAYHIDSTANKSGYSDLYKKNFTAAERWWYNEVNCRPDHQCADLLEANPLASRVEDVFFPYGNYNSLRATNGLTAWNGVPSEVTLTDITRNSDGSISFSVPSAGTMSSVDVTQEIWDRTAILSITISSEDAPSSIGIKYGTTGGSSKTITENAYENGKYAVRLENLTPRKGYSVEIIVDGSTVKKVQFTTGTSAGKHYIILGKEGRNSDGSYSAAAKLPLLVNNSADASQIEWSFNGKSIQPGNDKYFSTQESGELKAKLYLSDGSSEYIYKYISIK